MKPDPVYDVRPEKVLTCQACKCGIPPVWNENSDSFECPVCQCGRNEKLWSLKRWNSMIQTQIDAQKRVYKKRKKDNPPAFDLDTEGYSYLI
jgi:hypothetical protein